MTATDTKLVKTFLCDPNVIPSPPSIVSKPAIAATNITDEPIIDSGTSGHYFQLNTDTPTFNVKPTPTPITITLPNGSYMSSTHEGNLRLPGSLPSAATKVNFFDKMSASLISIGQLCDYGCTATFDQDSVTITHGTKKYSREHATPPPDYTMQTTINHAQHSSEHRHRPKPTQPSHLNPMATESHFCMRVLAIQSPPHG